MAKAVANGFVTTPTGCRTGIYLAIRVTDRLVLSAEFAQDIEKANCREE
jgi:hypothetical protein